MEDFQDFWRVTGLNSKGFYNSRLTEEAQEAILVRFFNYNVPVRVETLVTSSFTVAFENDADFIDLSDAEIIEQMGILCYFYCDYEGIEPQTVLELGSEFQVSGKSVIFDNEGAQWRMFRISSIRHENLNIWVNKVFFNCRIGDQYVYLGKDLTNVNSSFRCTLQGLFPIV